MCNDCTLSHGSKTLHIIYAKLRGVKINGFRDIYVRRKSRDLKSINLKKMVTSRTIDIRKVDKGQMILVIDYSQREKAESLHINDIASLSVDQSSNWEENKLFVESKLKELFKFKFISSEELTSVTGLLAGGRFGKLKNANGSLKFTRAIDHNELFAKQKTPYVYPLFKLHKLSIETILQIKPEEVAEKIPSRLVVGMSCCQLSRVQSWLESFLTPIAKMYGSFEYIKDSTDMLRNIEAIKNEQNLDWNDTVLYTIDVKSLYPSIKFTHLIESLRDCFTSCTNWTIDQISILIEVILYTLENQQVKWDNQFFTLSQGVPTGAKHSVPLANIFLTFILKDLLKSNTIFKEIFNNAIVLWKRFIDDCGGISKGNFEMFLKWYKVLKGHFTKYDLELTADTDVFSIVGDTYIEKTNKYITFLDIEIFKEDNNIHTKEHRKETSCNSYLKFNSAHPKYTFKGIMKSQLYRLRRLCSRDIDYNEACLLLKGRCISSGYKEELIGETFSQYESIPRDLSDRTPTIDNSKHCVRLVVLSGTHYEKEITAFANRMNRILEINNIKIQIVKTTGPSIAKSLFNNNNTLYHTYNCVNCIVCDNNLREGNGLVSSSTTEKSYKISKHLDCTNGGIYVVTAKCTEQYTGKTTNQFNIRTNEHFNKQKSSAVYQHNRSCTQCNTVTDYSISYVEDYTKRGKYTLSEREFLWNTRIKGTMNIQRILKG